MSSKSQKPFYYNTESRIGQFHMPEELRQLYLTVEMTNDGFMQQRQARSNPENLAQPLDHANKSKPLCHQTAENSAESMPCSDNDQEDSSFQRAEQNDVDLDKNPIEFDSKEQVLHIEAIPDIQSSIQGSSQPTASNGMTSTSTPTAVLDKPEQTISADQTVSTGTISGWNCTACTFFNDKWTAQCDVCETSNPSYSKYSKPKRSSAMIPLSYNEKELSMHGTVGSKRAKQLSGRKK